MIAEQGEALSRTKLRNWLSLSDLDVDQALEFGVRNKHLKKEEYNFYKILGGLTLTEERFYPAIEIGLRALWSVEGYESNEFYLERTARKDSKIAGPWTRPDFTIISHKKFPWTIGFGFDVVTFEIKRPDTSNVLAVFEALSHLTAATRSYVVFPMNEKDWMASDAQQASRVRDECSKHGIGLILIENVYDDPTPVHLIAARRHDISHEKSSNFLGAVLSDGGKNRLSAWK